MNITGFELFSIAFSILREDKEDKELSRRVEFGVRTNAEKRIVEIIRESTS